MPWQPTLVAERRRRRLPEVDETIESLDEAQRAFVAATCARRAELELRGGASFALVTQALIALRAPAAVVALASRAITQELSHSEIYLHCASRYAGRELPGPEVAPIDAPEFDGAGEELRHVLHVVAMCSVNETMACEFLQLCLEQATGPLLRSALRNVLADEIDHARIGWAYLATLPPTDRRRTDLAAWILPILRLQWGGWLAQIEALPREALPEHGCPAPAEVEAAGLCAMRDLVLPGFERLGVDVSAARAWLESGAVP